MIKLETLKNNVPKIMRFFPISVVIAFIFFIIVNALIIKHRGISEDMGEIIILLIVGFFLFVWAGLHQYSLKKKRMTIVYAVAILAWAYLGFEVFYLNNRIDEIVLFKLIFITLSAILAYTYVPIFNDRSNNVKMLVHINQLQYAFLGSLPFAILFGLAILVIKATLKFLFGFDMETLLALIYFNGALSFTLYTFFMTLLINPHTFEMDIKKYNFGKKRYLIWLLYAFTIIIFTVLNLFVLKIIFTQELPEGQVAWMVMGFSLFAFLSYFSLALDTKKIKKYNTLLWGTLLVQSLVLLASITIRVYEYGVTEKRYLLVAYGMWLFGISLYFLIKKTKAKIFYIFFSLSLLILLSQVGPFNGYLLSKYSQQQRFTTLIEQYGKDVEAKKYPYINELNNIYDYLNRTHGQESIEDLFPNLPKNEDLTLRKLFDALGIENNEKEFMKQHNIKYADKHYSRKYHDGYHVNGYDAIFINQSKVYGRDSLYLDKNTSIFIDATDKNISITIVDDVMVFDMEKLIKPLITLDYTNYLEDDELTLTQESQNYKIKIIFKDIWTDAHDVIINRFSMDIYVLKKNK